MGVGRGANNPTL